VAEHVLVAEQTLGRHLERDERVHHVNLRKRDNRPENLVVTNQSEHSRWHATITALVPSLIDAGIVVFTPERGYEIALDADTQVC
jgi:hypothetical protein